jgi:hypothetical protein
VAVNDGLGDVTDRVVVRADHVARTQLTHHRGPIAQEIAR